MSQIITLTRVPEMFADIARFLFLFPLPALLLPLMASSHKLTYFQNHIHQWMSASGPPFTDKNSGRCITSSIILGPLFSILSHTGASSQCEGGILFDRPVQMLNDSDTKRGPTTQVLTGLFSIEKRLDLT